MPLPTSQQLFCVLVNDNMSKVNPVFAMIFHTTQSPSQMHKASKLVDFFFFTPKERDMIQNDAILHKQ
jgi:hypothetical protein